MRARVPVALLALIVTGVSAACVRSGADHTVIEVAANEYGYEISGSDVMREGRATVRLRNDGAEDHQAALVRINDDATEEAVRDSLEAFNFGAFFGQVAFVGGPATIAPDGEQVTDQELTAGRYLFLCFVDAPDGSLHFAKGMIEPLKIEEGTRRGAVPSEEAEITLDDYSITMPTTFDGSGSFRVANDGAEPHELMLLALDDGKDLDDVLASFAAGPGERPYRSAGGISPVPADGEGWLQLDLELGAYAALCFVPSPAGKAHFELGMKTTFTIT